MLFPGKIAATVFSSRIEFWEKSNVFSYAKGSEIPLGVLILKFRLRRDLWKLWDYTNKVHDLKSMFAIKFLYSAIHNQ